MDKNKKERADEVLIRRGLAQNPHKAQALIMAGLVFSKQKRIEKPGEKVGTDEPISVKEPMPYKSRGGLKLKQALKTFQVSVKGKVAADLGASTGGFTDCLLQEGARRVYAVDVETRQLDWRLREDPRVILINKNARYLKKADFPDSLGVVTMDLSFISVLKVLPAVRKFLGKGHLLSLIKPQFEVGKGEVGRGGIVRDLHLHQRVLEEMVEKASLMDFMLKGLSRSSLRGQKGNREYFIYWSLEKQNLDVARIKRSIKEVVWDEKD
ncbi:MAG: TlyA family RNA methyltransferase [Candidatus Aminicenantes bacterium]